MAPPEDLRLEYEKQIENIRKLRTLYEERAAATLLEHRRELEREEARISVLETKLSDVQKEIEEYKEIKTELEDKIEQLESTIQQNEEELEKTKDDLFCRTAQNANLNSQITLINNLFSNMLVRPEVDFDRLTRLLNEHHGLITDVTTTGDSNEVAALLVDLAEQMDKEKESSKNDENYDEPSCHENKQLQTEIASNLSKVWRVMIELLSHHRTQNYTEPAGGADSCYKSIKTPTGTRSVISVSQTFLTLKDLILEKNKLVKEVGRLKTLNSHLENRLGSQEKRLSVVTTELRKTWAVVNKLKAQHKQLHTHEKILRYELQQKRCMLTELKGELEHCRDKWEKARQKNSQTEEDWKQLRKEFAARKSRNESNSAESGYEEDDVQSPPSESNKYGRSLYELPLNELRKPELSEEDIENSDGNSFDTVIDLLDIACLENHQDNQSDVPFVLCDVPPQALEIPQNLLPLTGSEFTDGLDQIESEDLAAVLDIQYQTQLLGADYNLSLPSSSGSSPIPTENDDLTSSEVDISEEDLSLNDNHIYSSPLPNTNHSVSEDVLLFGSNSSKNISRFLDGLFADSEPKINTTQNLSSKVALSIPSTSKLEEDSKVVDLLISNEKMDFNCSDGLTSNVIEDNLQFLTRSYDKQLTSKNEDQISNPPNEQTKHTIGIQNDRSESSVDKNSELSSEHINKTQEELLKAREDRLKRLEHQCRSLVNKVTSTSFRSEIISNKLDELHLAYGPSAHETNERLNFGKQSISKEIKPSEFKSNVNPEASSSRISLPSNKNVEEKERHILVSNQNETTCSSMNKSSNDYVEKQTSKLKILEDQCKSIYCKMSSASRNDPLINKTGDSHVSTADNAKSVPQVEPNTNSQTSINSMVETTSESSQDIEKNLIDSNQNVDFESKPPDLAFESTEILNQCSLAGQSMEANDKVDASTNKGRTPEEILEARAERFKRLEDQCKSLLSKMTATSLRSEIISNKLDELHSCYGSSEDASDNEEHSLLSKDTDKRLTLSSSFRCNKKVGCFAEKEMDRTNSPNTSTISSNCDLSETILQNINVATRNPSDNNTVETASLLSRISDDISPGQEQMVNKSGKMSSSSNGTDETINQELNRQNSQTSLSELAQIPHKTQPDCRIEQDSDEGSESFTNTVNLHADTKGSEYSNKTHK